MKSSRRNVQISFQGTDELEPYEPHLENRGRVIALGAVLLLVSILVYVRGIRSEFIFGEDQTVTGNTVLRARSEGLKSLWVHPTLLPHYQPLAYTLLLVEYGGVMKLRGLGGDYPQGYLIVNLLLHAGNVVLLWTLLRKLEVRGAWAGSALFAVHPINVEAVAWISQQPLLLCGVFYLSGLLVFLRYLGINPAPMPGFSLRLPEKRWVLYGLSIGLMMAALLSHAAAVTLPLAALVLAWWERGRLTRRDLNHAMPLLVIAAGWLVIAMYADARRAIAVNDLLDRSPLAMLLVACRAFWVYLGHLLFPVGLSFAYGKWTVGWLDGLALLGLAGLIAAAGSARRRYGRGPLAAVLLLLLALLPMFLIRTDLDRHAYVSDHLAYFAAMVLMAALSAAVAEQAAQRASAIPQWLAPAAGSAVALALASATLIRLPHFHSTESLWNSTLRHNPTSALANNQLGLIYLREKKDLAQAMRHFQAAVDADANDPQTFVNIATVYEARNELEKTITTCYEALQLAPDFPEARFVLANALAAQGNSAAALEQYERVLQVRRDHVMTHNNMGLLRAQRGEHELAVQAYQRAINVNPGFTPPYINLAILYFGRGEIQKAADALMAAVQIDPTNFEVYINAGSMVSQLAQSELPTDQDRRALSEQAVTFFRHAYSLRPNSALACRHLGMALMQRTKLNRDNKLDEAIYYLERAVQLEPNNSASREALDRAKRERAAAASS